jgi:hypothetical protein
MKGLPCTSVRIIDANKALTQNPLSPSVSVETNVYDLKPLSQEDIFYLYAIGVLVFMSQAADQPNASDRVHSGSSAGRYSIIFLSLLAFTFTNIVNVSEFQDFSLEIRILIALSATFLGAIVGFIIWKTASWHRIKETNKDAALAGVVIIIAFAAFLTLRFYRLPSTPTTSQIPPSTEQIQLTQRVEIATLVSDFGLSQRQLTEIAPIVETSIARQIVASRQEFDLYLRTAVPEIIQMYYPTATFFSMCFVRAKVPSVYVRRFPNTNENNVIGVIYNSSPDWRGTPRPTEFRVIGRNSAEWGAERWWLIEYNGDYGWVSNIAVTALDEVACAAVPPTLGF